MRLDEEAKERIWEALRGVYDPEIPVNVVELGLVYNNDVVALPEGGYRADIKLTLTAPGTGYTSVPTITFTGTAGIQATATARLGVIGVTLTDGGSGLPSGVVGMLLAPLLKCT